MISSPLLEICCDSLASALAAIRGGADRIELCSALVIGGLTPSVSLLEQLREASTISVRCLIRPRYGDFLYSKEEIRLQCADIEKLGHAGASGFVIGCLQPDGSLDSIAMKELLAASSGLPVTMHRAFDVCADPQAALETVAMLGIDTILTSGQKSNCLQGCDLICRLAENSFEVNILVGSGVDADVIRQFRSIGAARQFHMSGKTVLNSGMRFRREGVPMGLPGFDEYSLWQTDEAAVRAAAIAVHQD